MPQFFPVQADLFAGETVTLIGSAKTTVDYATAVKTENILLINHAIQLAPLYADRRVFHLTMHPEIFGTHPHLELPHVTPVVGKWGLTIMPPAVLDKTLFFSTRQFQDLQDPELQALVRQRDNCLAEGIVCHVANSSHCGLHFLWLSGCRNLCVIGASEYRGLPTSGYDDRLEAPEPYRQQTMRPEFYLASFRQFLGLLEWDSVTTLGY